jgi:hypothetical protein
MSKPPVRIPPELEQPRDGVVLPEPLYSREEARDLWEEQQVMRAENLMTKGLRDRRKLMDALQIDDVRTMDRIMRKVHARWEMAGLNRDHARARGEGMARLDMIERALWIKLDETVLEMVAGKAVQVPAADVKEQIVILKTIADVQKQRADLQGLTEKTIERLGQSGSDAAANFARKVGQHEQLAALASRALQMLESQNGKDDKEKAH